MKTGKNRIHWLLVCGCVFGLSGYAQTMVSVAVAESGDLPPATEPERSTATPRVGAVSRLQELEKKAAERDLYLARMRELQKKLDLFTGRNDHAMTSGALAVETGFGQLSKLKEKATLADQLARELEKLRLENKTLLQQIESLKDELDVVRKESRSALDGADKMKKENEALAVKNAGLQETIGRLLLGEFEYYEVKANETLQSIAANPLVYGDASRAGWLRQANEGRVKDLDRLRDGEMLVIPRFPRTGAYEF